METETVVNQHEPWNKGKLTGQKAPLKLKDIWAIRVRLQLSEQIRDLALFDLAIDCKLRACDLVKAKGARYFARRSCCFTRNSHATENATPGAIRDYGSNPSGSGEMDSFGWP